MYSKVTPCSSVESYVYWQFNVSDTSLEGKRAFTLYSMWIEWTTSFVNNVIGWAKQSLTRHWCSRYTKITIMIHYRCLVLCCLPHFVYISWKVGLRLLGNVYLSFSRAIRSVCCKHVSSIIDMCRPAVAIHCARDLLMSLWTLTGRSFRRKKWLICSADDGTIILGPRFTLCRKTASGYVK